MVFVQKNKDSWIQLMHGRMKQEWRFEDQNRKNRKFQVTSKDNPFPRQLLQIAFLSLSLLELTKVG